MQYIKRAIVWIGLSSADPNRASLMLRGVLSGGITLLTILAGLQHVSLPSDLLTQWGDSLIAFVQSAMMLISAGMAAYGLGRKVWTTLVGTNKVVNDHPVFANQ